MSARVGVVWNPAKAERGELEVALAEVHTGPARWYETTEDDPGQAACRRALDDGADLVLACGGDGTIRAVTEHLAATDSAAEMGIVPLGTGNLLARNLDVPLADLPAAIARALEGTARPIDVGWLEADLDGGTERHAFAVMAGFGIDAHMITETDEDLKEKAGWLAYVESLGRAVSASEVIGLRLALDGGAAEAHQAHTLIVGNCGSLQGGLTLLPDADPADGRLDLLVLHEGGVSGWLDTLRNMAWDNGLKRLLRRDDEVTAESTDATTLGRLTRARVELDEPRVVEVDGDDLGETTRIEISIQPSAVRIR
ncbi:diacylglycerol kinase family protein [Pseudactinotalea sp. HY158]|uniref:diacylglycerol/lipid kinase family protein n=1 Tax=Pseudactinotalea sp. HY158 TaxID=2654547 RepID=UPI00129C5436|nr:diacylglycerol kinase family protein [Pseudactinotalea sp. HY158]QGH69467.1 diacylglycerol kinase [Pseudactinotalea sp. HY158]